MESMEDTSDSAETGDSSIVSKNATYVDVSLRVHKSNVIN